jgi:Na+-driven multidrug efflux pump
MTELENKRLIARNTVALYVRMIVRLLVTLYTSRIVLSTLGFDDFAIYGIVGGVVTVFTFLQSALNASTQRFMSIELGKGNTLQLKKVFDTGMTLYLFVALIIVILSETAGLWFLTHKLIIPPNGCRPHTGYFSSRYCLSV